MSESIILKKTTKAIIEDCKVELSEYGSTILPACLLENGARSVLMNFGHIVTQFNGQETFEVTLKPGFDKLPFSQSKNSIGPHTEAPVYNPPPKYLALHCHRQAKCGNGHTLLADGFKFYQSLSPALRQWAEQNEIEFSATTLPGSGERRIHHAKILEENNGVKVFRFSYNQFLYGNVNPSESDLAVVCQQHKEETPLSSITALGEKFFCENMIKILIPENSMLIWNNQWFMHARSQYKDPRRHLTRYWLAENSFIVKGK